MRRLFVDCTTIQNGTNVELVSIGIVSDNNMVYYGIRKEVDILKSNDYYTDLVIEGLDSFPRVSTDLMKMEILGYLGRCFDRQDLKISVKAASNSNVVFSKYGLSTIKNSPGEFKEVEWWFKNNGLAWVAFSSLFGGEHTMRHNNISCKALSVEQELYLKNLDITQLHPKKPNIDITSELLPELSDNVNKYHSDNINNAFWMKALHETFIEK